MGGFTVSQYTKAFYRFQIAAHSGDLQKRIVVQIEPMQRVAIAQIDVAVARNALMPARQFGGHGLGRHAVQGGINFHLATDA